MPIQMASFFVPKNGASWYLVEDSYLKGGMRVVANISARSAIHPANLKAGMIVVTADNNKLWQLASDLITWTELLAAGSQQSTTAAHTHKQLAASDVWSITHGMNLRYFTYTAFDATGKQVLPNEMTIVSNTQVILAFSTPVAGHCTLVFDTTA